MKQLLMILLLYSCYAAEAKEKDTVYINGLLTESKTLIAKDPQKSMTLSQRAYEYAKESGYLKGEGTALKNMGIVYYMQQKYPEALDLWMQALKIFEASEDPVGISNILNNIAAVYKDRGVDDKALDYSLRALKIAESTGDRLRIMSSLVTIASIYHNKRDKRALQYLLRALPLAEKDGLGVLYGNIGEVLFDLGETIARNPDSTAVAKNYFIRAEEFYKRALDADANSVTAAFAFNGLGKIYSRQEKYDTAIEAHKKALAISEKLDDKWNRFKALQGIANAYRQLLNITAALSYYSEAQQFAEQVDNTDVAELYSDMSEAYRGLEDYKNALAYQSKYTDKQKEIYNAEVEKKMGRIQLDFDLYKKDQDLTRLTEQKKAEQQKKMGYAIGLLLVILIVVILMRNYKAKVRINEVLDRQKREIERLLLNILPAEVAKELQQNGRATPKYYDNVTVLFSDFKGFTTIADRTTPSDLVSELNTCFMAFDSIVEKYGLEKIKTIGDAYMCAGGIPVESERHSHRIVKAALEIQEWVRRYNEQRSSLGFETWDLRIGIHCGPLVAGVVGKKKYAYDIWGSTVNVASRMESNGEPGRINISAAVYNAVRDDFECSYRGKLYAKNVGEIDMYFVEGEKTNKPVAEKEIFLEALYN